MPRDITQDQKDAIAALEKADEKFKQAAETGSVKNLAEGLRALTSVILPKMKADFEDRS